jgi:hypothetical protein
MLNMNESLNLLLNEKNNAEKIFKEKVKESEDNQEYQKRKIKEKCEYYLQEATAKVIARINCLHKTKIKNSFFTVKNSIDLDLKDLKSGIFLELYINEKYFFSLFKEINIFSRSGKKDHSYLCGEANIHLITNKYVGSFKHKTWKKSFDMFRIYSDNVDIEKFLLDIERFIVSYL